MLTLAKLRRFAKTRNKSEFIGNLQFGIDAEACGFSVDDLGQVQSFMLDKNRGYQWKPMTKEGAVRVIEFQRMIYIGDDDDGETRFMLEQMNRASFETA